MHRMEHARPPGLIKEVHDYVKDELDAVTPLCVVVLILWSIERPVDEKRPADKVFFRHKAPVTAVVTVFTAVAHGEIAFVRDDEIAVIDVHRLLQCPHAGYARHTL